MQKFLIGIALLAGVFASAEENTNLAIAEGPFKPAGRRRQGCREVAGQGRRRGLRRHASGNAGKLEWAQTDKGLTVTLPPQKPCEHVFALKIAGDGLKVAPLPAE